MFNKDRFIQDCIEAVKDGQAAVRELVTAAISDPSGVLSELGEPDHAGISPIYRAPELTIINFAWAPCMRSSLQPPRQWSCRLYPTGYANCSTS